MALGVKICLLDTIFRLVGNALETFANCLKSLFPETTGSAVIPRNKCAVCSQQAPFTWTTTSRLNKTNTIRRGSV